MTNDLSSLARLIRYYILTSTTAAGSGHPTSSLSAVELITQLMFGGYFKANLDHPDNPNNDRLIFSKGHASPLLYAAYAAAGKITQNELLKLRTFDSPLEGHPTMRFTYTEAATGSLGQGLSVGVGMALNAKLDHLEYTTYVLLGDSEMAEGSNYEALQLASHYQLDNLVGIIDVNRLGQTGETMLGHDLNTYAQRVDAFGWKAIIIDGHDLTEISNAYKSVGEITGQPTMIIAKTTKGHGIPLFDGQSDWHGKPIDPTQLETALQQLGDVNKSVIGTIPSPNSQNPQISITTPLDPPIYTPGDTYASRKAYGDALKHLVSTDPTVVALDAETSNSTYAAKARDADPHRFLEMYIAEQNMVGTASGLAKRGKKPFISTFAAFFSRAFDQIRMAQYSENDITFVGSHAGVSIGPDGSSQMGLEDLAMFRSIRESVVLYPSDATSTVALVQRAHQTDGLTYIRTTRADTPVLYESTEKFEIGGSKTLRSSDNDVATIITAGITLHEALKAYDRLKSENIHIRIIDLYSIKPLDTATLKKAATQTQHLITVEDHYPAGGIGEAVATALAIEGVSVPYTQLAVTKMPRSGQPSELLAYMQIDADAIIKAIKSKL